MIQHELDDERIFTTADFTHLPTAGWEGELSCGQWVFADYDLEKGDEPNTNCHPDDADPGCLPILKIERIDLCHEVLNEFVDANPLIAQIIEKQVWSLVYDDLDRRGELYN